MMRRINPYKSFVGSFIPNSLLRETSITPGAKLVWARLAQYAGESGHCYPSQKKLAEELGCNKKTLSKYILELVHNEFIEVVKPTGRDKISGRSSRYYFLEHPCLQKVNPAEDHTGGPPEDHTGGLTGDHTGGLTEDHASGHEENHGKRIIERESSKECARPLADARDETLPKNSNTSMEQVSGTTKRKNSQDKKEEAMESYENFRAYMKMDSLKDKPLSEWGPRDFVIFISCGVAKYNSEANLPLTLPNWGRDVKTVERCMQSYGRQRLKNIVTTICLKKSEVEEHMGREFKLDISALNSKWILDCAEKVMAEKPVEQKNLSFQDKRNLQRQASALQRKRAEEMRRKIKERKNNG
jgi:hypothetical protein